ncbi:response regulator [Acidobacteria bacterium AB60]|nr:response regulator [Acidobacteria bacterium AB60]
MPEDQINVRVLVVDDDMRVADSIVQILSTSGYDAVGAYSAEVAMKMAEKLQPQVVISDVVMGPVSGIELAIHMREHHPECRVLLISGHTAPTGHLPGSGAQGSKLQFMSKPVDPARILEFVAAGA